MNIYLQAFLVTLLALATSFGFAMLANLLGTLAGRSTKYPK